MEIIKKLNIVIPDINENPNISIKFNDVLKNNASRKYVIVKKSKKKNEKILEDIISGYISLNVSLPDTIKQESPDNKELQAQITTIYNKILPDIKNLTIQDNNILEDDDINPEDDNMVYDILEDDILEDDIPEADNTLNEYRNELQDKYVNDAINLLSRDDNENRKVLIKGPTGFGKTVINYKIINHFQKTDNITLILTPRRLLNTQTLEDKYKKHLDNSDKYVSFNYCPEKGNYATRNQELFNKVKTIIKKKQKIIILSCYQSFQQLINYLEKQKIKIDLCICDEAHYINSWSLLEHEYQKTFFGIDLDTKNKIIEKLEEF